MVERVFYKNGATKDGTTMIFIYSTDTDFNIYFMI